MTNIQEREAIARAIQEADDSFGYSMSLIRLVDDVSTYRFTISGEEPFETEDRDEGYERIAFARNKRRADAILALIEPSAGGGEDALAARRWNALMRVGRIKMQGSAGVDPHTGERNGNNVHFGAEFWPERADDFPHLIEGHDRSTAWGKACLTALADAVLEREAAVTPDDPGQQP